ncbi:MAG: GntR family transcriptional regulator [Rhodobacteraceae bacterium]|nr:GntR family transcriptional regulator [Paracoccaceae bacterium]
MTPRGEYKPGNANRPGENTSMSSGKNLNEIAYRTIKDDIISCALQPGDDISEATLLARYGFSKAPIRSALLRLRQEGLVVSRGRRGNMVSQVTFRDVQEIFQLRLMLEVVATRLAAGKVDPDRILNLNNAVVSSFSAGREQKDETEYMKANREFHRYIAESSGNQRLAALVIDLMEQHERIVHLGLALQNREREFLHRHDDLVSALIDGDGDRAARLAEHSLRGGQRMVVEALLSSTNEVSECEVTIEPGSETPA